MKHVSEIYHRDQSHKTFGVNLQSPFCKLTNFINVNYIFLGCEKIELSKRLSKLNQKSLVVRDVVRDVQ